MSCIRKAGNRCVRENRGAQALRSPGELAGAKSLSLTENDRGSQGHICCMNGRNGGSIWILLVRWPGETSSAPLEERSLERVFSG